MVLKKLTCDRKEAELSKETIGRDTVQESADMVGTDNNKLAKYSVIRHLFFYYCSSFMDLKLLDKWWESREY